MANHMVTCRVCGAEIAKSAKTCPQCGAKNSKPVTKRWWFWTLIALVLLGAIGGNSSKSEKPIDKTAPQATSYSSLTATNAPASNNPTTAPKPTDTPAPTPTPEPDIWLKGGTYKVGTDIEAGEYLIVATSWNCYVEVDKDSSGTFDSIVSNENTSTHLYYTLIDGQYFKVQGGKFARVDDVAPFEAVDGVYDEGMYLVGRDIPAGEYKITANESVCYIEVDKDSYNTFNSIVSNDIISIGESTYITIKNGQYIKISGGQIIIP